MDALSLVGDMAKMILKRGANPIEDRCIKDPSTALRLRYNPYYRVADANDGITVTCDGHKMVMMSSNEYLGLSRHPKVIEASALALKKWGASSCGSRISNGSRRYHVELEEELAAFLGREACHVFSAGYLACMSGVTGLSRKGDAVILDCNVHACLWDAASLCAGTLERFAHQDTDSLQQLLESLDPDQPKIIVVDGVYSMEGHIAKLPEIAALAQKHKAFIILDDAHGFGVLGEGGRGTCNHFGLDNDIGLIAGSFSKSLASCGGFIAANKSVIEFLRTQCRQIIFSAALPPASTAAALAALRVLQSEPEHRQRVLANADHLRRNLDQAGLDYWGSQTPAVPIIIGDTTRCFEIWKDLWKDGFFTVFSISPGVPVGKELIRCAVSSLHTTEQLDRFTDSLVRACKKAGMSLKKGS